MTTIETHGHVGPDGKMTIDVPPTVPEGDHRIVVWVDDAVPEPEADPGDAEKYLEWDDGLLVYTGPVPCGFDFQRALDEMREERTRQTWQGDGA